AELGEAPPPNVAPPPPPPPPPAPRTASSSIGSSGVDRSSSSDGGGGGGGGGHNRANYQSDDAWSNGNSAADPNAATNGASVAWAVYSAAPAYAAYWDPSGSRLVAARFASLIHLLSSAWAASVAGIPGAADSSAAAAAATAAYDY